MGPLNIVSLPLEDSSEYLVSEEKVSQWAELYPGVDVAQQLRSMRGWLLANPSKRKTRRGIERFINGWLARQQERVGEKILAKPKYHNRPVAPPGSAERAAMERMMARRLERERRQV